VTGADLDLATLLESSEVPDLGPWLDLLARRIHVGGKVHARYSGHGKRRKGAPLLGADQLHALAAALLALARAEADRGRRLKALNASLAVADLAGPALPASLCADLDTALEELP